jgi:hypothetical protein
MNKIISILITFLSIIIFLLFLEFNTEYFVIDNISKGLSIVTKPGTLFIGTHNYEHKDVLITFQQFKKYKNNHYYMLFADKLWNNLLEPLRPSNIEFIYVKDKTVEKLSAKLLLGHSVIMFLYSESDSTGPYYIIQNTLCPLVLFKINKLNSKKQVSNHYNSSFYDIYINNFMSKFSFEMINYKYSVNDLNNKKYLTQIKNTLYS